MPHEKYCNDSLPAFACDPQSGQLYLAWSDFTTGTAQMLLTTSKDLGSTWSKQIRVNDDTPSGAQHVQPQIAVSPDGVVTLSFFDTRYDPQHHMMDVSLAQSVDHAATFLPNVRVTTQSWNPDVGAPLDADGLEFLGDYQGLAVDNLFVHSFGNDTRTGQQAIFTAALPSAQPAHND